MNAIPAMVAGVDEIAMVVPPAADGSVNPYTLAAAAEAGVDEIYKVGGAQAVAALAYGTDVDPARRQDRRPGQRVRDRRQEARHGRRGHRHARRSQRSARARRRDRGARVRRHRPHGAGRARPARGDLPRHDRPRVARPRRGGARGAARRVAARRHHRRSLTDNGVVVVCPDIVAALDTVDLIAPEHLEVQMAEPFDLLGSIRNAGAIFLGPWTPESVGDYVAGPNHVLPTGGTARFSSPLSVDDFVKKSSVISLQLRGARDGRRHRARPSPRRRACGLTVARSRCASSRALVSRWKPNSPEGR